MFNHDIASSDDGPAVSIEIPTAASYWGRTDGGSNEDA